MQSHTGEGIAKGRGESPPARAKPRLRGVSHRYAFLASLLPCLLLVFAARGGRATAASAIYAGSLVGLLGTSAVYHGIQWSPRARYWVARVDLTMIFVLIAGTYTPIAMLKLQPELASAVLAGVWGVALAGAVLKTFWEPPKWASAAIFVAVGSVVLLFLPPVVAAIGARATAWMALGGAFYVAGAVVYGLQRPDPAPAIFGYHEIFHAFVIAGAAVHFVTLAVYVIPTT